MGAREAIREAVRAVLLGVTDATDPKVIFAGSKGPRPTKPYLTVRVASIGDSLLHGPSERRDALAAATHSTVTLTLGGDEGTVIPAGSLVEGGGSEGDAQWETLEDATIGEDGTVEVEAQAATAGPVAATAGVIDEVVTVIAGWDTVTNADAAITGFTTRPTAAQQERRDATVSIQAYGEDAIEWLSQMQLRLDAPASLALQRTEAVTLLLQSPVTDLSALLDTAEEDRASLELRVRYQWRDEPAIQVAVDLVVVNATLERFEDDPDTLSASLALDGDGQFTTP